MIIKVWLRSAGDRNGGRNERRKIEEVKEDLVISNNNFIRVSGGQMDQILKN